MEVGDKVDARIQKLFDIVQKKKEEINNAEKPQFKTNLSFRFDENSSTQTNLNVVNQPDHFIKMLSFLMEKKNNYDKACKELEIELPFKWSGFTYDEWLYDIKARFNKVQISEKKKDLEKKQKQLDGLISPEMKRELELVALEKELED